MLRLLAYAYAIRGPSAEKSLAVDLAIGLMRAIMPLAERAARLPAGPSNPDCNAGMSFIALRDAGALRARAAARRLFVERLAQLAQAAQALAADGESRARAAADAVHRSSTRARRPRASTSVQAAAATGERAGRSGGSRCQRGAAACAPAASAVETSRRREARTDLEGKTLHPFALLRDAGAAGVSCQREGTVDPSGRHAGRAASSTSRTCVRPGRSATGAATAARRSPRRR